MRFETIAQDDFQIPAEHLCDGCGYEPVFSEQAKCEVCVKMDQFNRLPVRSMMCLGRSMCFLVTSTTH